MGEMMMKIYDENYDENLGQNGHREVCAGVILETLGVVLLSEFGVNDSVPCTAEGLQQRKMCLVIR